MRRVFLVRHGQTDMNVQRIVQGPRLDPPLSAPGKEQARAVARRLLPEPIAAVYTSPMLRARQTAQAIADVHGLEPRILAGFTEYDWGLYCGRKEEGETEAAMKGVFAKWWAGDLDARPADGETAREAELRVRAAFAAALAESAQHPAIAVVAHGRINKILLASLLDGDLAKQERYPQHNTAVTLLEGEGDAWRAVYVNDTAHRRGVDLPVEAGPLRENNA